MPTPFSQTISREFCVSLPQDVTEWLDGSIRDNYCFPYLGDFSEPCDPAQLLDPSSSLVWGGLMPPDTLPILNNGCGDAILLRFGKDGHVSELIHWAHEGGYWKPFGQTLAEAILCDIILTHLNCDLRASDPTSEQQRPIENWAVEWVRRTSGPSLIWPDPLSRDRLTGLYALLDAGICEVAVRRELCAKKLTSGLLRKCLEIGGGVIAERLGVEWPVMSGWLLDTSRIPDEYRVRLAKDLDMTVDELVYQDWAGAIDEAIHVQRLRPDLGWTYYLTGRSAERGGDMPCAIAHYFAGLKMLKTGSEFMGYSDDLSTARGLAELRHQLPSEVLTDLYFQAATAPLTPENQPSPIRHYWMREAVQAETRGDYRRAYLCYYSAGWDVLVFDDIDQVLEGLVRSAEAAGYPALFHLAKHHLASLRAIQSPRPDLASLPSLRSRMYTFIKGILGK